MDFILSNINQINWWAVIVATLATMPVGYVWYDSKMGFGKRWAKMNGLKEKDLQSSDGMAGTFSVMLAVAFVTAVVMACMIEALGISDISEVVIFGLVFGAILRGGAHFVHNGFSRKPMELTLIDAGHDTISLIVIAVIIGIFK